MSKLIAIPIALALTISIAFFAYQRFSAAEIEVTSSHDGRTAEVTAAALGGGASTSSTAAGPSQSALSGPAALAAPASQVAAASPGRLDPQWEFTLIPLGAFPVDSLEGSFSAQLLGDLPQTGQVLMDCFELLYQGSPERPQGGKAALRLSLMQEEGLGAVVTNSEYLAKLDGIRDDEFEECFRAGGFALRIDEPIGPTGTQVTIEVGLAHEPSRAGDEELRAAMAACVADLKARRPDLTPSEGVSDEAFGRCMDRAAGTGRFDEVLERCLSDLKERHPASSVDELIEREEFAACAKAAGIVVLDAEETRR